jgi:hypothetical protein
LNVPRCQIETEIDTDDLGGLGHEVGIVALAPGFAAGKIDLLRT